MTHERVDITFLISELEFYTFDFDESQTSNPTDIFQVQST